MSAPKIGLSACFFHADPARPLFKGKTLLYMEQSMAHWVMREGALVYLIPSDEPQSSGRLRELLEPLDGLILQGGADVAPESYGEKALKPEWSGDIVRDRYELQLVKIAIEEKKPILGICRGAQLLNVALGGTLYQDINTQVPRSFIHRDWETYDGNHHTMRLEPGSLLQSLYPEHSEYKINSIHHQAVKTVGPHVRVEAKSTSDGIIEAIRYLGDSFAMGVQWHPEFHPVNDDSFMSGRKLLLHFLAESQKAKK